MESASWYSIWSVWIMIFWCIFVICVTVPFCLDLYFDYKLKRDDVLFKIVGKDGNVILVTRNGVRTSKTVEELIKEIKDDL